MGYGAAREKIKAKTMKHHTKIPQELESQELESNLISNLQLQPNIYILAEAT